MITEIGSRTKIRFLQEILLQTKPKVLDIHEELIGLIKADNMVMSGWKASILRLMIVAVI